MPRFNGKQDLSKAQLLERNKRKSKAMRAKGLPTPKGTQPKVYKPVGKPGFIPMGGSAINLSALIRRLYPRPEKSTNLVLAKPKLYLPENKDNDSIHL